MLYNWLKLKPVEMKCILLKCDDQKNEKLKIVIFLTDPKMTTYLLN